MTDAQRAFTEQALIEDIKEFIPMFHRPPTAPEVVEWALNIYDLRSGPNKSWAKRLIKQAATSSPFTSPPSPGGRELEGGGKRPPILYVEKDFYDPAPTTTTCSATL